MGPGPAPRLRVVVGLVAGPAQPDRAEHQPPEPALFERLARLHDRQVVAVLVHDEQLGAVRVARLDHPVGVLEPQRHRLFDDDRAAVTAPARYVTARASRSASARRTRRCDPLRATASGRGCSRTPAPGTGRRIAAPSPNRGRRRRRSPPPGRCDAARAHVFWRWPRSRPARNGLYSSFDLQKLPIKSDQLSPWLSQPYSRRETAPPRPTADTAPSPSAQPADGLRQRRHVFGLEVATISSLK